MSEKFLDLRGLKCPLPALRVKKMLSMLQSGDVMVAACTDPMAAIDIPNLLRQTHDILETADIARDTGQDILTFRICKR